MFAQLILFATLLINLFAVFVRIESSETSDFDFTQKDNLGNESHFSRIPTESERHYLIRKCLFAYKTYADEYLIENIVELTNGYTNTQIMEFLIDMLSLVEKGKEDEESKLEYAVCLEKLKETINRIDKGKTRREKLIRIAELIFVSAPLIGAEWTLKGDFVEPHGFETTFPTEEERFAMVKEALLEYKKSASEVIIQEIVERTAGFDIDRCRNFVISSVKDTKSSSLDQDRLSNDPLFHERYEVIEEILLITKKSAPESLIRNIAELTSCYDMHTITKLVKKMVKESKTVSLDRNNCIAILKKAADLIKGTDLIEKDSFRKFQLDLIDAVMPEDF